MATLKNLLLVYFPQLLQQKVYIDLVTKYCNYLHIFKFEMITKMIDLYVYATMVHDLMRDVIMFLSMPEAYYISLEFINFNLSS